MPNPWTGIENLYTWYEIKDRLSNPPLHMKKASIALFTGTVIGAKFIEKGVRTI
jgi:hypothetical protein